MSATVAQEGPVDDVSQAPNGGRKPTAAEIVEQIRGMLGEGWPGALYRERILTLRTRSHRVFAATKGEPVEIQHTLLGIELKVGPRRKSCPDLATARYLSVFARMGVEEVAIPYEINRISHLADELESSLQRMLLLSEHLTEGRGQRFQRRVAVAVLKSARVEIEQAGPGTAVPEFKQTTSQRRRRRSL